MWMGVPTRARRSAPIPPNYIPSWHRQLGNLEAARGVLVSCQSTIVNPSIEENECDSAKGVDNPSLFRQGCSFWNAIKIFFPPPKCRRLVAVESGNISCALVNNGLGGAQQACGGKHGIAVQHYLSLFLKLPVRHRVAEPVVGASDVT